MATNPPKSKPAAVQNDGFHVVNRVIGSDTYMVLSDSATRIEDEFSSLYQQGSSKTVLKPPYLAQQLAEMVYHNNILNQCVEVMEVNIDGTGYKFEAKEEGAEVDKAEEKRLAAFFDEPYPGVSFIQIRRKLRRDMESCGYAALEVLTNMQGGVVGLRNMDTYNLRFIKLDDPVMVSKEIERDGKTVKLQMMERERRFIQRMGNKYMYYREYGTTREVHKDSGEWETKEKPIAPEDRGTQILVFGIDPDTTSPYSVPRWINQMPSVIGSRKAEEQNLEFFDAGGLPPAIIFVQGGTLAGTAADQLRNYLSGKNKNKNRAVVVEAQSSSGSMESAGSVKVSVERFGADKANDSMYSNYDKNAEEHVRIGFRLPALFLGRTDNYNYATAVVAYMVAEEQVFQPERIEFDEIINKTIMRALGAKTCRFKSNGITLKNVDAQITALTTAMPLAEGKGFIEQVNKVVGLDLKYEKPANPMAATGIVPGSVPPPPPKPETQQAAPKDGAKAKLSVVKGNDLVNLAMAYGKVHGLLPADTQLSETDREFVRKHVDALEGADLIAFNSMVAAYAFGTTDTDMVELASCGHAH